MGTSLFWHIICVCSISHNRQQLNDSSNISLPGCFSSMVSCGISGHDIQSGYCYDHTYRVRVSCAALSIVRSIVLHRACKYCWCLPEFPSYLKSSSKMFGHLKLFSHVNALESFFTCFARFLAPLTQCLFRYSRVIYQSTLNVWSVGIVQ